MSLSQKKNSSGASSRASRAAKQSYHPPPPSEIQWVAVQLSPIGEREKNLSQLIKAVHQIMRSPLEVFIPAISQKVRDESETMYFMEGYIFVQYVPSVSFLKLQDTTYFSSVLCRTVVVNGRRQQQYSLLSDMELSVMRVGLQDLRIAAFAVKDLVRITRGNYKNLIGEVVLVYEDGQNVQVAVNHLRSKKLLMDYPVTYLTKV